MRRYFRNPLFLFYLLVIYVVAQFSWWLYLIANLYNQLYTDQILLQNKTMMLVGEGSVFVLILFGGVYMIKKAYQREREINQLQENFLLSVSHELKTPISSITLFLQTLKKRDLSTEKKEEIYTLSLNEIKRLENIVNNLLITRSIENKNYYFNQEKFDLKQLIESVIETQKETVLKKHKLKIDLQEVPINGDKDSFVSILNNLLQNASKYSPADSQINIHLYQTQNTIEIKISDEGIGIDDAKKQYVFKRFYRTENEMTRQSKGTGLGLFIVKYLVESHQGKINLMNNQPKGLTVHLTFPRN